MPLLQISQRYSPPNRLAKSTSRLRLLCRNEWPVACFVRVPGSRLTVFSILASLVFFSPCGLSVFSLRLLLGEMHEG